ncbi:MAG: hypothetical protein HY319_06680 [Armatimonadetes bacterium]|nr:hypothetical protein [Armatimonadota bacterium]
MLRLTSRELFGQLDYLHDFSLSADRTNAYVLAGAYGPAEVELRSADQIVEDQTQQAMEQIATPQEPVPIIRKDEETVTIEGITLPRRNLVRPQES